MFACIALSFSAGTVQSQQSQPPSQTPPPATSSQADHNQTIAQQSAQGPRPALRVLSQLVQVDVIAKDHNGNPVEDLKQSDFSVYEDGKHQEISWYSVETDKSRAKPVQPLAPNTYSNLVEQKTGVPGNLTILLLDFLNTRHSDVVFAKDQVIKLLKEMKPEDRVAVYALSGRLYVLHDFTSDLGSVARSVKGFDRTDSADLAATSQTVYYNPTNNDAAESFFEAQANQNMSDFANIDRAETTCGVFQIIAEHMMRVPGRKNLIWVSGSFPFSINMDKMENSYREAFDKGAAPVVPLQAYNQSPGGLGPQTRAEGLFMYESRTFKEELDKAIRALAGSNIALYPVDPRGLIGNFGMDPNFNQAAPIGPQTYQPTFSLIDFAPNIDTMRALADGTGGQAFYNTNDIGASIRKAIEDSHFSYMLSYYPPPDDGRGGFHKIRVKVNRPGIELRYRSGYLATPLNFTGAPKDNSVLMRDVLYSPLDATGVGMTVHVDPFDKDGKRTLNLIIALEERDLTFHPGDDRTLGNVQVVLAQFDSEGKEISGETSKVDMRLYKDTYQKIRNSGLHFGRNLVLNPAATELRVLACDDKSGAIGSVSIPLAEYFPAAGR